MKPSYYHEYEFISPEPLYAEVKEELKSYFQTGVVDDLLFTRYTEHCLDALGKSSYKIVETFLELNDYSAPLPEGFEAVRELWVVTPHEKSYTLPTATYAHSTELITPIHDRCIDVDSIVCPREIQLTCKTTGSILQKFTIAHLLRPGNLNAKSSCSGDSINLRVTRDEMNTFDVRDGKVITTFPSGVLFMVYYVREYDNNDNQTIPDNIYIKNYIKAYLKYKCFETIFNNVSDETFNQLQGKLTYYENKYYDAKAMAEVEIKKQTTVQSVRAAKASRRRLNRFVIR